MNQGKIEKIIIARTVLNLIERFKQRNKKDNEAGGILLGQVTDNEVYILKITTPNKFDRASRYSFDCNKDAAQVIINYEFLNSSQKTIYIGEWHTHSENFPSPSGVDKNMINNQYFKNKINEPFLILIIQGIKGLYVAIYDGKKLEEAILKIIENE